MGQNTEKKWYRLDNAAKIIPSTARGANTRVFRIICELYEEIDPEMLQQALDETIVEYPLFNCILRRGFFWYYLEDSEIRPVVTVDCLPACSPLYYPDKKNLLYRVCYFKRRIVLEMFHVLADGTGAFMFFRRLVTRYLEIAHDFRVDASFFDSEASSLEEKMNDAFRHFYKRGKGLKQLHELSSVNAYQLTGEQDVNLLPHLTEGCVSAQAFVREAKKNNATVGVFAVAVYIASVIDGMSEAQKKRMIVISVPVNLRQFFPSNTARNFFGVIRITYDPQDFDGNLSSITETVDRQFKERLKVDNVIDNMNSYTALERNPAIKVLPLLFKDLAIQFFDYNAKRGVTSSVSNMGQIRMPVETHGFIQRFSGFMTATSQQITICTFKDQMVFGEVSPFSTHRVMLSFYRRLTAMGIPVTLSTNDHDRQE